MQSLPYPLHLPPPHGLLLGDPVSDLSQHVDLIVLGQQLDLYPLADLMPRPLRQRLLITG
jgi:hypothetical protein